MTTKLTEPISKKLLAALLIVAIGAEIILYLTRYSTLASDLYDAVMVGSLFVGWRIYRRLSSVQDNQKTKRQRMLQFTGAFLFFFIGSTFINIYSGYAFNDFSDDYDQYVADYTDLMTNEEVAADAQDPTWTFIDKVDTVGYDIYQDSLAGLEEVWRLSYIILLLLLFKKVFRRRWESGPRDIFLMISLFVTSILFGIDHTLAVEEPWKIKIGAIVTFANMGLLFGLILFWTRSLWVTVLVHSVYDIMATMSWYYYEYSVEVFAFVVLVVHMILFVLEKRKQRRLMQPPPIPADLAEMAE